MTVRSGRSTCRSCAASHSAVSQKPVARFCVDSSRLTAEDGLRVLRQRHAAQVEQEGPRRRLEAGQRRLRRCREAARAVVDHAQRAGPAQVLAHVGGRVVADGDHLVGAALVAPGREGIAAVQVVEVVHRHDPQRAAHRRQCLVELVQRMPQRIRLGLHVANALPALDRQVADLVAEQPEQLLAAVEVELDAVALPSLERLRCEALAGLRGELAQAIVKRADVAQADADAAMGHGASSPSNQGRSRLTRGGSASAKFSLFSVRFGL
jgi:hypothetical protein